MADLPGAPLLRHAVGGQGHQVAFAVVGGTVPKCRGGGVVGRAGQRACVGGGILSRSLVS